MEDALSGICVLPTGLFEPSRAVGRFNRVEPRLADPEVWRSGPESQEEESFADTQLSLQKVKGPLLFV